LSSLGPDDPAFNFNSFLTKVFRLVKKPVPVVDAKIILLELFETETGIYNHLQPLKNNPLSSISFKPINDTVSGTNLENVPKMFIDKRIKDLFNISLLEYLQLPRDLFDTLNEIADSENRIKGKEDDETNKLLKNMTK
jgi:hypothetical protein